MMMVMMVMMVMGKECDDEQTLESARVWEMILPSLLLLLSGQSLGSVGVKRGDDDFYEKSCNLPISHVLEQEQVGCGNWLCLGWVGVRRGDCGDEGGDGDDKEDGEEDSGFHDSAPPFLAIAESEQGWARNQKNGEDNIGVVEDCEKHDRDDPSCFSCLGRVWARMGLGTPRRSTP